MEFKTYNIDGDNIYIASPLGLAELNRDYRLLNSEKTQFCEDLLKSKNEFDLEMQAIRNNITEEGLLIGSQHQPSEKANQFFENLSKVYSECLGQLNSLNNSNVPEYYKNKTIYIITSPEAFRVIKIKD